MSVNDTVFAINQMQGWILLEKVFAKIDLSFFVLLPVEIMYHSVKLKNEKQNIS